MRSDGLEKGKKLRIRIIVRRRGIKKVNVGKKDKKVRENNGREERRKNVIVEIKDLGGWKSIVLIDDRKGIEIKKGIDGWERIEIEEEILSIGKSEKNM